MNKYYAGIGSRKTPKDVLYGMETLAYVLYKRGYTLRTGGAPGADTAFELGVAHACFDREDIQNKCEIYLPWPDFQQGTRSWIEPTLTEPGDGADYIAHRFHPRWNSLSDNSKKLIARNTHQILGRDLANPIPSEFVVCWTEGGKGGGGTGQALRIAKAYDIPIYDLAKEEDQDKVMKELMINDT